MLERVEHGERAIITRDGRAIAELRPLPRRSAGPAELIERRKRLPRVDAEALVGDARHFYGDPAGTHRDPASLPDEAIAFDGDAARVFGTVAAALRASGRKPAARVYDALIAASAIAHGLPLFTCNPTDFEAIPHLDVRPISRPHQPGAG